MERPEVPLIVRGSFAPPPPLMCPPDRFEIVELSEACDSGGILMNEEA